jgi:hypothetical protein
MGSWTHQWSNQRIDSGNQLETSGKDLRIHSNGWHSHRYLHASHMYCVPSPSVPDLSRTINNMTLGDGHVHKRSRTARIKTLKTTLETGGDDWKTPTLVECNFALWLRQAMLRHPSPGTQRVELPVSKITRNAWGGLPMERVPKYLYKLYIISNFKSSIL